MVKVDTEDVHLKRYVYTEIINDRLAKLLEIKLNDPDIYNKELDNLRRELARAYRDSRIFTDNDHFKKWDSLIISVDSEIAKCFRK